MKRLILLLLLGIVSSGSSSYIKIKTTKPYNITNTTAVLTGFSTLDVSEGSHYTTINTPNGTLVKVNCYFEYGTDLVPYMYSTLPFNCTWKMHARVTDLIPGGYPYKNRLVMQISSLHINALGLYFITKK